MAEVDSKPVSLSIAGLDPSGGAGIIADIKTFYALGCYGAAAVTSVTFQNTQGVFGAVHQSAESVRDQVIPIIDDFRVDALKTGMLPTRGIIDEVARIVSERSFGPLVVDPVVRSTSGFDLIDDEALRSLIGSLFPLAAIVTPNLAEAERIARMRIATEADVRTAAQTMLGQGAGSVLIKGGHQLESSRSKGVARDYFFGGNAEDVFEAGFIETNATHGTGCTLSAAIAAGLAKGLALEPAIAAAKSYVTSAIRTAPPLGKGHSPVNH